MATGYTYPVVEGEQTELKDFVLNCARAFFYDLDKLPDKFENGQIKYHQERITEDKLELKKLSKLTKLEQLSYGEKEISRQISLNKSSLKDILAKCVRVLSMLKKVQEWKVTKTIQPLKDFMIEQLQSTIKQDCNEEYYKKRLKELDLKDPIEYYKSTISSLERSIKYHEKEILQEEKNNEIANKFLKELKKCLK